MKKDPAVRFFTGLVDIHSESAFQDPGKGVPMTEEVFEQAVHDYANTIFRVACHVVKDRQEAEDVTQTVLMRLYQYAGEFQSGEHMKHWLLRVAVNESRKVLRSPWRKKTVPLEDWDTVVEGPEEQFVLEAVMALDVKYRLPVYLYYYEDCSVREIAAALRTNPSTVQTRLQRAREKLRNSLCEAKKEGTPYVRPQIVP